MSIKQRREEDRDRVWENLHHSFAQLNWKFTPDVADFEPEGAGPDQDKLNVGGDSGGEISWEILGGLGRKEVAELVAWEASVHCGIRYYGNNKMFPVMFNVQNLGVGFDQRDFLNPSRETFDGDLDTEVLTRVAYNDDAPSIIFKDSFIVTSGQFVVDANGDLGSNLSAAPKQYDEQFQRDLRDLYDQGPVLDRHNSLEAFLFGEIIIPYVGGSNPFTGAQTPRFDVYIDLYTHWDVYQD